MMPIEEAVRAQAIVSSLTLEQIRNTLENLALAEACGSIEPGYVALVRKLASQKLSSFHRGRRGLVSVPRFEGI